MQASGAPAGACISSQLMGFLDMVWVYQARQADGSRSKQQAQVEVEEAQYKYLAGKQSDLPNLRKTWWVLVGRDLEYGVFECQKEVHRARGRGWEREVVNGNEHPDAQMHKADSGDQITLE